VGETRLDQAGHAQPLRDRLGRVGHAAEFVPDDRLDEAAHGGGVVQVDRIVETDPEARGDRRLVGAGVVLAARSPARDDAAGRAQPMPVLVALQQ
jgi:hypothetical protein